MPRHRAPLKKRTAYAGSTARRAVLPCRRREPPFAGVGLSVRRLLVFCHVNPSPMAEGGGRGRAWMAAGGRIARRRAEVDVADRLAAASCLRLVARVVCRRLWFVVLSAAAGGAGAYAAVALRAPSELFSPHADRAIATTALTCGLLTLTIIAAYVVQRADGSRGATVRRAVHAPHVALPGGYGGRCALQPHGASRIPAHGALA